MYADHRRTIAAPESCCNTTINLHQKKNQRSHLYLLVSGGNGVWSRGPVVIQRTSTGMAANTGLGLGTQDLVCGLFLVQ